MKRGDIVLVAGTTGPAAKPRPCLVVQRTSTIEVAEKVTICPLTSSVRVGPPVRPIIYPDDENGLKAVSEVETDWVFTYCIERIGATVGSLDPTAMLAVDAALRGWLDL